MSNQLQTYGRKYGRKVGQSLLTVLSVVFLMGWTGLWATVALVGAIAGSGVMLYGGLIAAVGGWLSFFGRRWWRHRQLTARAEASLMARADLHGISLSEGMAAHFHVFDDSWLQLQASLADPSLPHADRSAEVTAQLVAAQEQLFSLAQRYAAAQQEIRQLGLYSKTALIEASRDEKTVELARIETEAEEIVSETRQLAATADQVRQLAAGRTAETKERLKDAVSQFNHTLAAFREVEAISAGAPAPKPKRRQREPQSQQT